MTLRYASLTRCRRCDGWVYEPTHLLGPATPWPGGTHPFPRMRWCTPGGIEVLPFYTVPTPTRSRGA